MPCPLHPQLPDPGPQQWAVQVHQVQKILGWEHLKLNLSQCQVRQLPGEHQLPFPMAVTPQEMETRVLLGQQQGWGLLVSLPHHQVQAGCWPPSLGVGKQTRERWGCPWEMAEQQQAAVAVLQWGSAIGQAAGMVWPVPQPPYPLWAAQCLGVGDSCHSVYQWEPVV